MIGWLNGVVHTRDPLTGEVILDVSGVGYQITVSLQTLAMVPEIGQECALWIHTHVREDVLALFGFGDPRERKAFRLLTGVPQVGPKLAISVLGGFPLDELLAAIESGNRGLLERIPGVGKRTAERILLDLHEKVAPLRLTEGAADQRDTGETSGDGAFSVDARAILTNLGWKAKDVEGALTRAEAEGSYESLDALVRAALALLMSRG